MESRIGVEDEAPLELELELELGLDELEAEDLAEDTTASHFPNPA